MRKQCLCAHKICQPFWTLNFYKFLSKHGVYMNKLFANSTANNWESNTIKYTELV